MKIEQKLTANYHPQTNMTERVNRTLKPLLAIYAQRQPHSWDKEIQKLAFAIRTSVNETTGDTPAFLMFGRDIKGPLDLIIGDPSTGPPPTMFEDRQIQEYKTKIINNLRCAYNTVLERSEIEKCIQKTKYDQHTTQRQFTVGDLVWVAIPPNHIGGNLVSGKLHPHYQGPCRLMKQLSPVTFIVRRLSDNVDLGATNADRLKPYYVAEMKSQLSSGTSTASITHDQDLNDKSNAEPAESINENQSETLDNASDAPPQTNEQAPHTNTQLVRYVPSRQRRKPARYDE